MCPFAGFELNQLMTPQDESESIADASDAKCPEQRFACTKIEQTTRWQWSSEREDEYYMESDDCIILSCDADMYNSFELFMVVY